MKKFEVIDWDEVLPLVRIRALRDIERYGVKAGDLGGVLASEANLSQYGECWVRKGAKVLGEARIIEDAIVEAGATVLGESQVRGEAFVDNSVLRGHCTVFEEAKVFNSFVSEDATIGGNASITGSTISGSPLIHDSAYVWKSLITDRIQLGGDTQVYDSKLQDNGLLRGIAQLYNCIVAESPRITNGHFSGCILRGRDTIFDKAIEFSDRVLFDEDAILQAVMDSNFIEKPDETEK